MKEGFRQSMAWLHTWTGLVVGWVLFFVFVTGTAGYVDDEISRWMRPELPLPVSQKVVDMDATLGLALNRLEQVAPDAKSWTITLPQEYPNGRDKRDFSIAWEQMPLHGRDNGSRGRETLDPQTGEFKDEIETRATRGGVGLYRMHYALHYIPYTIAINIIGVCTMLMFLAILSGIITHKKIFTDFFTFRPGKGQRSWLDAHNIISVMALPFFLMITYSGLLFFTETYMPAASSAIYGTSNADRKLFYDELLSREVKPHEPIAKPAADLTSLVNQAEKTWGFQAATIRLTHPKGESYYIDIERIRGVDVFVHKPPVLRFDGQTGSSLTPEDKSHATMDTNRVFYNLHEGVFADWWLRWLYLAAGFLGCGMIGTGLVLWTVKRREKLVKAKQVSRVDAFGIRLVEVLNVATIIGLPIGIAAYFWANRLLPVDLGDRAAWEMHTLFAVWAWTFFYSLLRPVKRAWMELIYIAVAAYGLIPLLNFLTTDRHLGVTIPYGDWQLAGFDLSMFGFAALFAYLAKKLHKRWLKAEQAAKAAAEKNETDKAAA
jgi:uncharacterized iron-regulated membrane protein